MSVAGRNFFPISTSLWLFSGIFLIHKMNLNHKRTRFRWMLAYTFIVVTSFILIFCQELFSLGKDIFRLARSEIHLLIFDFQWARSERIASPPPLILPSSPGLLYIAHTTGQVNGVPAQNSLEGFNASFGHGCRLIESDFEWTHDHHLVSTHDWRSFFGAPLAQIPDLKTFVGSTRLDGFRQLTFEDVNEWLIKHPSARLVTDVKSGNPEALKIFRDAKSYQQIIPQTYSYMEFLTARKLGFSDVILTTYKTYYSDTSLRRFAETARPSAVTVPVERLSKELISMMSEIGIPIFTHPVLLRSDLDKLPKGVKGVYSSTLCE